MHVLCYHTNHHCLTSTCWPAGYHGNKPSSFQSYRHWSPPCGLVIAAFQHTEYTLFVTHVCSHSHSLSSVPTKLQSVDGSAEKPKSTFTVTLQESLMDYYNTALDLWRKSANLNRDWRYEVAVVVNRHLQPGTEEEKSGSVQLKATCRHAVTQERVLLTLHLLKKVKRAFENLQCCTLTRWSDWITGNSCSPLFLPHSLLGERKCQRDFMPEIE